MSATKPKQLLEHARWLATSRTITSQQVNLRRAVSAAYYGLFHLLIRDASRSLTTDTRLRRLLPRAFSHEEMASACKTFASRGTMPQILEAIYGSFVIPPELARVAQAFIDLQKARHDADYATHIRWTRSMALDEVERAEEAFANWERIRPFSRRNSGGAAPNPADSEIARLFLVWLVFQKKVQGR